MTRSAFSSQGILRTMATLVLPAMLLAVTPTAAQQQTNAANMQDRKLRISNDINLALPAARRGLQLLQTANGSEEQILRASETIFASYRYLRSAQESGETVLTYSPFPDPIIKVRNAHIQKIRDRLRYCRDSDGLLVKNDAEVTERCLAGLAEAVHDLEILIMTLN